MTTYSPKLFISVGETHAYFTLRETELVPFGGRWIVSSFHHQNLSVNADEAFAKAQSIAQSMCLPLESKREELDRPMREIVRLSRDELESIRLFNEAQQAEMEQARQEREKAFRAMIDSKLAEGVMPVGKFSGSRFDDLDLGYVNWIMSAEFDDNSVLATVKTYLLENFSHRKLPSPDKTATVGEVGQKINVTDATVIRIAHFYRPSFSGYGTECVSVVTLCTKGGACLLVKTTGKFADNLAVGDVVSFSGKIKAHSVYNGQSQTVIERATRKK